MTVFRFRLERVLDFRRIQLQLAESECHRVEARLTTVQAQHAALVARKTETRQSVARLPMIDGRTLAPLTGWFRRTETEDQRYTKLEQGIAQELQKRRVVLIEAHRKVRLLEKLREKRQAEWQSAADRETEEIAADAVYTRYTRQPR